MADYFGLLALIGTTLAYHAWREHKFHNLRDARLLGASAAMAWLTGAALWFN